MVIIGWPVKVWCKCFVRIEKVSWLFLKHLSMIRCLIGVSWMVCLLYFYYFWALIWSFDLWSWSMILIYDLDLWSWSMMLIYDPDLWSMILIYDLWSWFMIMIYDPWSIILILILIRSYDLNHYISEPWFFLNLWPLNLHSYALRTNVQETFSLFHQTTCPVA